MFRSVFSKFVLSFAAIILVSFAMLSALITAVFSSYATEERNAELSWAADSAASLVEVWIEGEDVGTLRDFLRPSTEELSSVLDRISESREDLSLFLADENGNIVIESGVSVNETYPIEASVLQEILASDSVYLSEGMLGGVFENLSFYAAIPIKSGERVIGYAVSAVSNSAEHGMIGALNRTIVMSSLWVMLAALVAAYFISDYMVKPINVNEMVLRVSALLRRAQMMNERRLMMGSTVMECDLLTVTTEAGSFVLPQKEFMLLYKMASYPGKIFTRQQLMDEIWGYESDTDTHTVDVHIGRLRDRFRDSKDFSIVTIRGVGYKVVKL